MSRQLRVQYPGAIYHLMSRGDRREDIFLDDVDRQEFLRTLAEACPKTGWQVHAILRRKSDPEKLAIAARLRKETTLSVKEIAARLHLGTSKSANSTLRR